MFFFTMFWSDHYVGKEQEGLCAMNLCLGSQRIFSSKGLKPVTSWSKTGELTLGHEDTKSEYRTQFKVGWLVG